MKTPVGSLQIITPLIARHNVYNILAAVAVGLAVTVDGEPIPLKVCAWPPMDCRNAVHCLVQHHGHPNQCLASSSI